MRPRQNPDGWPVLTTTDKTGTLAQLSEKEAHMPEDQSPPTAQETVETDGAKYLIRLNGPQNVVMRFEDIGADPEDALFVWGFASIAEYRRFLKMLTRFDEALGTTPPAEG